MDVERTNLLNYCMQYVEERYLKVIRIDFKTGKFEICKMEDGVETPGVETIYEWLDDFIKNAVIHPDDINKFKCFAKVEDLRKWIASTDRAIYCSYRRKTFAGDYVHVSLCVIRDKEYYNEEHEYGILYVKDINSIYETEYECVLEDLGTTDSFTKLLNRLAYQRDINKYKGGNVGVIFADINGLKYINDTTKSHKAGDKLILDFANLLKSAFPDYRAYHISGDEFIVVAFDVNLRNFLQRALAWHRWLWEQDTPPMASVGYSLDANTLDVEELVAESEKAMYVDKQIFYNRYPEYKRK